MCCFFEEEVFDVEGWLCVDKVLVINKIGYVMYDFDLVFSVFFKGEVLCGVVVGLGLVWL